MRDWPAFRRISAHDVLNKVSREPPPHNRNLRISW
jgi:hypothetical protein